ncbi:MAG: type 4a pilus biogenesis protein PilO, partial [Acidimicrobiia bacterium]|nr:type 4a pilus biogenesis protein PilO [Acidimicrobiia bacterium]
MSEAGTRTKLLLGILVLVLITVLWFVFFFSPRRDAIAAAETEHDNALLRESTLRTRLSVLQEIKDNELSYLFAIGEMEASIPTSPQADAFIEDITFLAESTGVELSSISLTPPLSDPTTGGFEVPIAITIEGEYFELLGFLYGVEALDRLVRVDGITLTPI